MKRALFVAACLIGFFGVADRRALAVPARQLEPAAKPAADPRQAALLRDPRSLPRAADGRWKDFGSEPLDPQSIPPGIVRARDASVAGDLPLALVSLLEVLEAEPGYPPALHQLGVLYFRLQRYGDAAFALELFLAEVPERIGDTRVLGHAYYSLGEYDKARDHYERVLARSPDEVEALRGLALSKLRLGDAKRALELLEVVLEREPGHVEAWTWKAQILYDAERGEDALAAVTRARDLDPYQPRAWFLLGRILLELGREEEGLAAQQRHRELDLAFQEIRSLEGRLEYTPHDLALLARLVEVQRSTGNVARTRTVLARLMSASPGDPAIRIYALDVLEQLGDAEGARLAAQSLEKVGAEDAASWERLERYYARTKDRLKQLQAGEHHRRLRSSQ